MEMDTKVTVHDAMTSRVITVEPQTSVAEAARIMTERNIGSLIIKSNAEPEGLITESDIIAKVVSKDLKASQIQVGDLMTQNLIRVHPGSELNEAARVMAKNNIRRLPVVNNGVLVGILTTTDVVSVSQNSRRYWWRTPGWRLHWIIPTIQNQCPVLVKYVVTTSSSWMNLMVSLSVKNARKILRGIICPLLVM